MKYVIQEKVISFEHVFGTILEGDISPFFLGSLNICTVDNPY
jgi:hypothetical protein